MIYVIVGKTCSGKTSLRKYFENQGFIGFEASNYAKRAIEENRVSDIYELFNRVSKNKISKMIHNNISKLKSKNIVISGLRTPEEVEYIKKLYDTRVIGIYTSDKKCFERFKKGEKNSRTFEWFYKNKICGDYSLGLDIIFRKYVDFFIENNSSPAELNIKLEKIIDS